MRLLADCILIVKVVHAKLVNRLLFFYLFFSLFGVNVYCVRMIHMKREGVPKSKKTKSKSEMCRLGFVECVHGWLKNMQHL